MIKSYQRKTHDQSDRGQRRDDIRAGLRIVGIERRVAIAFTVSAPEVTILASITVARIGQLNDPSVGWRLGYKQR
jgi:hypothetical protein